MSIWHHKNKPQLRRFGLSFGAGLTVLSTLLFWRDKAPAPIVLGVALTILAFAALAPRALAPLEWLLERIFKTVTLALTYLVLTLVFFLVVTPIGLIVRATRRDPMGRRPDRTRASYWVTVEPNGPGSRPDKPF
jgi:hypothetical protein